MTTALLVQILGAIWLDLILSGDNAVVIALAVRGLPPDKQRAGMALGVGAAILLRLVGMFCAAFLMTLPGLRIVGALFLVYVVYGMLKGDDDAEQTGNTHASLLRVALLVGMADATMSLDNIVAVAALANGNPLIMTAGILISIPFVVLGAALIKVIIDRAPFLIWLAAGLIGYVAIQLAAEDSAWHWLANMQHSIDAIAIISLAAGLAILTAAVWHGRTAK